MALLGDLSDLPLIDLMQVLTIQRRSGILTLVQSYSQAQVAFTQSRVYSAFLWKGSSQGREIQFEGVTALHELLDWKDGQFTFELTNVLPPVENVNVPFEAFIRDHYLSSGQGLLEEDTSWEELCPELVEKPNVPADFTLNMDELRTFRLINGILSIRDIAEMARLDIKRVISIARDLEKNGLITVPRQNQPLALPGTYLEYRQNREAAQSVQTLPEPKTETANFEPVIEILPEEIKPAAPMATAPEQVPAPVAPRPTVKLDSNFPSFNTIEAVLQTLPMGPSWLTNANPQPQPVVATPPPVEVNAPLDEIPTGKTPKVALTVNPFFDPFAFNLPLDSDSPVTTPGQPLAATVERFVPSPTPKLPSRLQSVPIRWDEKAPVEEALRPKVKRSLLGTIMAKIRGL